MKVLVAGGAGYIGSHTVVELIKSGHEAVIVDDLSNAKADVIDRIQTITGVRPVFYEMDCKDNGALRKVFLEHKIDAIIHFAAFKAVGESVQKPLQYYRNNLDTALSLLEVMEEFDCKKFIFSSSSTVYGPDNVHPYKEDMLAIQSSSPYGWTKVMIERILTDYVTAHPDFCAVLLRYFNPIGAHESGLLGDDPNGIPNNLMPYIGRVAAGQLEKLTIFGDDYPTKDGTCVRDYIHVTDLAQAHVLALDYLMRGGESDVFNLGNGVGFTVKEVIDVVRKVTCHEIPVEICPRRAGDPAQLVASSEKAKTVLGWNPRYADLETIVASAWNWHKNHPHGFEK